LLARAPHRVDQSALAAGAFNLLKLFETEDVRNDVFFSSVLNINIGMPACCVVRSTFKATAVIPGVAASLTNVGALKFGEKGFPSGTRRRRARSEHYQGNPHGMRDARLLIEIKGEQAFDIYVV
jgi:hypothetical protein